MPHPYYDPNHGLPRRVIYHADSQMAEERRARRAASVADPEKPAEKTEAEIPKSTDA